MSKEAKDKAEELIDRFMPYVDHSDLIKYCENKEFALRNAIQCALICVDEIINLLDDEGYGNDYIIKFYQQVKQEILNCQ